MEGPCWLAEVVVGAGGSGACGTGVCGVDWNAADVGGNGCGGWWNGISCWRWLI